MGLIDYLTSGQMTAGQTEMACTLILIYSLSMLAVYVLYRVWNMQNRPPPTPMVSGHTLPSTQSTLALIKSRRSIMPKDLSGEHLTRAEVELVLEAANWAPTHQKTEPWRFTVLDTSEAIIDYLDMIDNWYSEHKEDISEADYDTFSAKMSDARSNWPQKVSHLVVISMVRQTLPDYKLPEWEELCAVATSVQNMHLAITSVEGAGGFWSSHTFCKLARDSQVMRDFLGMEDKEDRVLGAFLMGKVQAGKKFKGKRSNWEDKVIWK